jgi:DNA-binding CsgD family transcriptional regulator
VLGLTPRVAETLLWLAQGKTNAEIATILGNSESTVKKHVLEIFQRLSVETRTAASLWALEVLSSPAARGEPLVGGHFVNDLTKTAEGWNYSVVRRIFADGLLILLWE